MFEEDSAPSNSASGMFSLPVIVSKSLLCLNVLQFWPSRIMRLSFFINQDLDCILVFQDM